MLRILIPCLIWLSTVRSDTGMHMSMPNGPLMMDKMLDDSALKPKRDSIHHQPCGPIYPHVPAYAPQPAPLFKPFHQQTYLKKELGVQPLAQLQYVQQPVYSPVVPKPGIAYVKPAMPAVNYPNYQTVHQSLQYVKPVMPIYQKPHYYAPMYHQAMYHHHDAMPKVLFGKYEAPVSQILYQKPQIHTPKIIHVQEPQVSYVKPAIHASPPVYVPQPHVHNPVVIKPHCV